MRVCAWPCPAPGGPGEEFAAAIGPDDAERRLLIVPALFAEANRTRRMLAEAMRAIAASGHLAVLIDLPGCGESLTELPAQDLGSWRAAAAAAVDHFAATEVLSLRGGALVAPPALPGWQVEPIAGPQVLRPLVRAAVLAAREAGRSEHAEDMLARGREHGCELAGYRLGAGMVRELERAELPQASAAATVKLDELGGSALWLRSEPGDDPALSSALAALVTKGPR